jgi:hypothetical protein
MRRAAADALGHHYPASDRELAFAALCAILLRAPRGGEADRRLFALVADLARGGTAGDLVSTSKRETVEGFLAVGALVHVDARRPGVEGLPPDFADSWDVCLVLGHNLPIPIPDLALDLDGISATLSFNSTPHRVKVPWSAVWGVRSVEAQQQMRAWPASVPPELAAQADAGRIPADPPLAKRPDLKVLDGGSPGADVIPFPGFPAETDEGSRPSESPIDGDLLR